MSQISRGMYATACESSPHKNHIDQWINEGKSNAFISKQLKAEYHEEISDKSVAKYRKYRDDYIQEELEKDPVYQGQMIEANKIFIEQAAKVKAVDVLAHLSDIIEYNADLVKQAQEDNVKIKNAQDLRFTQMTILDAIKLYGETILKAQKFNAINDNPDLLRPQTININVKNTLKDILKEVAKSGGDKFGLIDRIRASVSNDVGGGFDGDTGGDRSGIVDGESEDIEGTTVFVHES